MGIFDGLQGGGNGDAMGAISHLIGNHEGGLDGLVQAFQNAGLGEAAQSWISGQGNIPISAEQVQSALGSGVVAQFAERLGVDPQTAAQHLSELLPQVVDHLTPNGEVPSGAVEALEGLLNRFKG